MEIEEEKPKQEETPKRRGEEGFEIDENEKSFVKVLLAQISKRLKSTDHKRHLEQITKNREYARGTQNQVGDKEEEGVVRANLIHPELKKAQNECYAKNPEISITPTESVSKDRYETWKQVGKTLEIVLNNQFAPSQADLKAKAKRAVRSADTTGFGWLKVIYQKHIESDPMVAQRMDDVQDNIQTIDRLMDDLEKQEGSQEEISDQQAKKEELKQQLNSLEEKKEVVRSQGLSFAVRPSECILFSEEVVDVDDIQRADWITDTIWMRESKVKERFGFCPKEANRYNEIKPEAQQDTPVTKKEGDDNDWLIRVYEMWRKGDKRIYTMCEGYEGYLKEPYTPRKIGERFHGFFPLIFDAVDGSAYPNPLVTQLTSMQDEHITTRSNFKEHRERSVPFNVAHGGLLDPSDTGRLTNPKFMETVVLKSAPDSMPLDQVFKAVQHNPIDPAVYSTDHIRQDWEQVTRRGDAARGTIGRSKTATEADILQANLNVDTSERRDVVEDWFGQVGQYSAELVLQEMSEEEAKRIAGESAAWPQLTRKQVFDMVELNVRVGSSGKPNAAQEMERWLKMLPQFREALMAIVEMKEAGKDGQAEILTKLLRETIERFEERIDLDALLPQDDGEEDPEKQAAAQQQQAQFAMQLKDMVSTIANRDADTMKKIAEAEAKESGPQIQLYMTLLQGLLNQNNPQPGSVQ